MLSHFDTQFTGRFSRRTLLRYGAVGLALGIIPLGRAVLGAPRAIDLSLTAAIADVSLVGAQHPATEVWSYNGRVPGPVIRARQGDRLRVVARNRLTEPTSIHWHGIRLPNAMDGVPGLTQAAIEPGKDFTYEFDLEDAGTFWYHPHINSGEQVGRGLAGALIVEERNPPKVDRDLVWVLDDWRLDRNAAIAGGFSHPHDLTHAGRIGNTATINGRLPKSLPVRSGERIRLRLVNVANARTFGLRFEGHEPKIVALDGQPVPPHTPKGGLIVVGAGQRTDIILDMGGKPGARTRVVDAYYRRQSYRLTEVVYSDAKPLRDKAPDWPITLRRNPIARPDLKAAVRQDILLQGGAMSGMMGRGRMRGGMGGPMMGMRRGPMGGRGANIWALNGRSMTEGPGMARDPLLTLKRGSSYRLVLRNETAFEHPMHIHGHTFRVLSRNGVAVPHEEWRDTVLVRPRESVEIALVADNPGNWMFHCHVLEHQIAGMMGVVRVT